MRAAAASPLMVKTPQGVPAFRHAAKMHAQARECAGLPGEVSSESARSPVPMKMKSTFPAAAIASALASPSFVSIIRPTATASDAACM